MSLDASIVQSIANTYFKVIDNYNNDTGIITNTTNLPVTGKNTTDMLTELTAALKDFKGKKYWMILKQGDVYYVIFLNSTVTVEGINEVETKDSWIVGDYISTKSQGKEWTSDPVECTYEITKTGENVTGLKLTSGVGSAIEFNLTSDGDTPIATLNGSVDDQFKWTADKRTAILTSSGITDDANDTNAVFYNPTNMKVGEESAGFSFKSEINKFDSLTDANFKEHENVPGTIGYIILKDASNAQYTTQFRREEEYLYIVDGAISQKLKISDLNETGDTQSTITLPNYSGLEGDFTVSMLYQKLALTKFKTFVNNGEFEDPREYLFLNPANELNEITTSYVSEATADITSRISELIIEKGKILYRHVSFNSGCF